MAFSVSEIQLFEKGRQYLGGRVYGCEDDSLIVLSLYAEEVSVSNCASRALIFHFGRESISL